MHTFSRRVQPNQLLSYAIVASLLIVYHTAIQNNYRHPTTRIAMTVIFMLDFTLLLISTFIASKTDPADPIMVTYRNGDKN